MDTLCNWFELALQALKAGSPSTARELQDCALRDSKNPNFSAAGRLEMARQAAKIGLLLEPKMLHLGGSACDKHGPILG